MGSVREIILNENQSKVVEEAVHWYWHSSSNLFQIDGEAGTGKSVVLNEIKRRLGLQTQEVLPMAYTGQAAIVMRTKGFENAITCHSGLFEFVYEPIIDKATGMPVMDKQFNMPVRAWKLVPRDFSVTEIKLIIIDEAWMTPLSFRKYIERTGIKTIVAGDSGQLPPVNDQPAYLVDGQIHHLTELMRQSYDSPIVYLARRARRGLPIEYGFYGNDVAVIDVDELSNEMISRSNIVVCNKNKTREFYNFKVRREILGTDSPTPIYGERMICRKNNWSLTIDGISLANGLVGTVIRPPKIDTYSGKTYRMDFLPDLLQSPFMNIECDFEYLMADFTKKQSIKNSPYSTGEKFEYAYASTCHLVQGSEYPYGIYIEEFLSPQIQNNLNYTAITRFRNKLIYCKRRPKSYFNGW